MTLHLRNPAIPNETILTLGLLTPHNVHDPQSFSGTAHHAARALARAEGVRLRLLGPHRPLRFGDRITRRRARREEPAPPQISAGDVAGLDMVVGLVATGLLDRLPAGMPYLHVTDATPGFLADVYNWNIPAGAHLSEARVARRAAACVYSSHWMARRAQSELGLPGADALAFGINLDLGSAPETAKPPLRPVRLLYVGADWDRKGGDIALAALAHLRAMGVAAELTLVGRIPAHAARVPGVTVAGFLDKTRRRHARRLADLYARAHLLVLPTRGDCTPMVIAEAMAHGTPVLATETGGIPEMIGGGGAGSTLPMAASPEDWARMITHMTQNTDAFEWMSDTARDRARTRFSWDAWARGIAAIASRHTLEKHADKPAWSAA